MHANSKSPTPDNIIPLPQTQKAAPDAPYSQEAEEALLGSCLLDPKAYVRVRPLIPDDKDFYFLRHMYIWQAMTAIFHRGEPVDDLVVLSQQLESAGHLQEVGGVGYLTQLMTGTPTAAHAVVYAEMIRRIASRRRLWQATDKIRALLSDHSLPVEQVREQALATLMNTPQVANDAIAHVQASLNQHWDVVDVALNNPQSGSMGFPTGLGDLDSILNGLHRRKLYVVAGINHHGKTSLMMTIALNAARAGARVAYFNVADGDTIDVISRMIAMEAGLPPHKVLTGALNPMEYSRYVEVAGRLGRLPLYLKCGKGMSPRRIYDEANTVKQQHGLDVVIIDYIQRIKVTDAPRAWSEYQRLSYISQQMTILGDDQHLNCAMIVGAQINRQGARKANRPPTRQQIKGCGGIEEDADVVLINWFEAVDNKDAPRDDLVQVIVEKNKVTGQLGSVWTKIDKISTRITDWETPESKQKSQ
jgi:replicative DNA helicase